MADIMAMEREIAQLDHLPVIPVAARYILKEMNGDSMEVNPLCRAIEQDPGSVAKLLSVANSAYYAKGKEITSVKEAIVLLGMEETRRLVLAIAMSRSFDWSVCSSFNAAWYWEDALNVAYCADMLGRLLTDPSLRHAAYVAGLLHNIGILVLVQLFPHKMAYVCSRVNRMVFGHVISRYMEIDHRKAGGMLLRQWQLPESIITVTENIARNYQGDHQELVSLVKFAMLWYNHRYALVPDFDEFKVFGFQRDDLRKVGAECRKQLDKNEQLSAMLVYQ